MRHRTWLSLVAGLVLLVVAIEFHSAQSQEPRRGRGRARSAAAETAAAEKITHAVAVVQGLGDHRVKGKVTFTQKEDGVEIVAEFTGLTPGEHGFHVHEFGDCSMADGKCAGGHFNPTGAPHGGPDSEKRHIGDMCNVKADDSGKATYKRFDKLISLNGRNSVIGRS